MGYRESGREGRIVDLASLLAFLSFFQSAFVIPFFGGIKLYQIISFPLVLRWLYSIARKRKISTLIFIILLPYIASSIIHLGINFFDVHAYGQFFDESRLLRLIGNILLNIAPLAVFYMAVKTKSISDALKVYFFTAACVSLYAIYMFFLGSVFGLPDIVPQILDVRNSDPSILRRSVGFSTEPSILAYSLATALILIIYYEKRTYAKLAIGLFPRNICFLLIIVAGILTFSPVFFLGLLVASVLRYGCLKMLVMFTLVMIALFAYLDDRSLLILGRMLEKISELFLFNNGVNSSGSFRGLLYYLGFMASFENGFFGLGPGQSAGENLLFVLSKHGPAISFVGIKIVNDSVIPGSWGMILGDLGVFGVFLILGLMYYFVRHINSFNDMLIALFFLCSLVVIYPIFSFFVTLPMLIFFMLQERYV